MKRSLLLLVLFAFAISSCRFFGKRIKGNGSVTTEKRPISGYTGIDVSSSIDVYVKQDSVQSVSVETDANIQEYVTLREEGGILYISLKKNYNPKPTAGIKVYVSGPVFRSFDASGACDFYTQNMLTGTESVDIDLSGSSDAKMEIKVPKITADLSGACSLTLKGETKDLEIDGTGSSSMKCMELMAENVDIDITGAGSADVFASVKLNVSATGSGSVRYKGNPAVSQKITGAGSVNKVD